MAALAGNDSEPVGRKEYHNMNGSNFMQGWLTLVRSLAMIALILGAFGIMLGIVKPADVPKRVGAVLGIIIALILVPTLLASLWSAISLWQRLALAAIGFGVWQARRSR
jgi:hypothetical protein